MAWAQHGHGMASVNQTRPHCVNQMGKTHFKPLVARHGRGMAWARHAVCVNRPLSAHSVREWVKPSICFILLLLILQSSVTKVEVSDIYLYYSF